MRRSNDPFDEPALYDGAAQEIADKFGRQVAVQLAAGNGAAAHRVVDEAINELNRPRRNPAEIALAEIYPTELANLLEKRFGMLYLADLRKLQGAKFLATEQVGPATLEQLIKGLLGLVARHG